MKNLILIWAILFSTATQAYPLGFKATTLTTKYPALVDLGFLKATSSGSTTTVTSLGAATGDSLVLGGTKAASAVLDVQSTTQGFLPPRMTTTQRDAISSPDTGLTIFNTTTNTLNTWNGTLWMSATLSADTDWVDCGLAVGNFSGFGSPSSIEDLCKRDGADLLMRVKFTAGTVSATEARVALMLNGNALTSAGSAIIPSLSYAGNVASNLTTSPAIYAKTYIEPSVGYLVFGGKQTSQSEINKMNGNDYFTTGQIITFDARIPINGWTENTGNFSGIVQVPGGGAPKTFSGIIAGASSTTACSGTCIVYNAKGSNIGTATRNSAGDYSLAVTGLSGIPNCTTSSNQDWTVLTSAPQYRYDQSSSSSLRFNNSTTTTGARTDGFFTFKCDGD